MKIKVMYRAQCLAAALGVAAALAKALGESGEEFFGHDYCINNHVYTTLLKQLSERKILK